MLRWQAEEWEKTAMRRPAPPALFGIFPEETIVSGHDYYLIKPLFSRGFNH